MYKICALLCFLCLNYTRTAAQQNWAAVPCFELKNADGIGTMFVDSINQQIILNSSLSNKICGATYKAIFSYNGQIYNTLDFGINTHDPNIAWGSQILTSLETFQGKTIFTGNFLSVGSQTLYAKSIALWDGLHWSNFSHPFWNNTPSWSTGGSFSRVLRHNGKLYMFAGYDSLGNAYTGKPLVFDGTTFQMLPPLPVSNQAVITEAIMYKQKLIVAGNFYNLPNYNYFRLAQFDGTTWSPMGAGIKGNLSAIQHLAIYRDTLYIGGSFPKSAGNAGNYLMKWDGNQLSDAGFSNVFCGSGSIYKLLNYRNRLYAFGTFTCAAGQKAFGVAYYENGLWKVPKDSIDLLVSDAVVFNDAIYMSGYFNSINGDTTLRKFVKLNCPDFDAASGCLSNLKENKLSQISLYPNPASGQIRIEGTKGQFISSIRIHNSLGQPVYETKDSFIEQIDISQLQAGLYLMEIRLESGVKVLKFIKS